MVPTIALLFLVALMGIEAKPASQAQLNMWQEYKTSFGKSYKTQEEESARFSIFLENQKVIDQHNEEFKAGLHTFELGVNKYADMTNEEFRSTMNGFRGVSPKPSNAPVYEATTNDIPAKVDWRTKGYVTDVKDQGQCGSCWAFSATGSLEGQNFKKNGKLVSLSEQNLVDCSRAQGNQGCNGGWMDQAFQYIKVNKGIDTEQSYPYEARDDTCRYNAKNIGATDTGFTDIKQGDETALEQAAATIGPISVAIDASGIKFQLYKNGVYYNPSCSTTALDHGVLVVGYDTDSNGTKYYIVKNSWGKSWGQQGYLWMSRERNNNCGIATSASYPTE